MTTARVRDEPELEFGGAARHIDPRGGVADYGPADLASATRPDRIRVGLIGTASEIEGIRNWLHKCSEFLPGKQTHQRNLFPHFPGCNADATYRTELVFDPALERPLSERQLRPLSQLATANAVRQAVDIYAAEVESLMETSRCDIVVCVRPSTLLDDADADKAGRGAEESDEAEDAGEEELEYDFHDQLKASAMRWPTPLQVVRPTLWLGGTRQSRDGKRTTALLQDEATRAWNIHTALYYKAGGVPWRLRRESSHLSTCFVGVSFYFDRSRTTLHTSVAQVFNERGDGVIVRGGQARVSRDDRQAHLSEGDAHDLLISAIDRYRHEHLTLPARLVLHKSSAFSEEERRGFEAAADERGIHSIELIWFRSRDGLRLFRRFDNPPLRGTLFSLDALRHVLYTRGSVPYYATYPGMYIPTPLAFEVVASDRSPRELADEVLALTKMNWNQTQFDGRLPITLRTARAVGRILKYVPEGGHVAVRYANYM
jgi:hypothetical protein